MLCALVVVLLAGRPDTARAQWAVEAFLGSAASAQSTLTIEQAGQPTLRFTADYATRPTEPWIYYAFRVSRWWGRWGGLVGFTHHKLYLTNNPPEVENFQVTNGYNLGEIGAGYLVHGWSLLGSVGPVVANPISEVRGLTESNAGGIFGSGNSISGVNLQLGVNRRFYFVNWGFLTADLRLSAAWAQMEVADGNATVPNYAVHFLVGLGGGKRRVGPKPAP